MLEAVSELHQPCYPNNEVMYLSNVDLSHSDPARANMAKKLPTPSTSRRDSVDGAWNEATPTIVRIRRIIRPEGDVTNLRINPTFIRIGENQRTAMTSKPLTCMRQRG